MLCESLLGSVYLVGKLYMPTLQGIGAGAKQEVSGKNIICLGYRQPLVLRNMSMIRAFGGMKLH